MQQTQTCETETSTASISSAAHLDSWSGGGTRVQGTYDKQKCAGEPARGRREGRLTWGLGRCWWCVVHLHLAVKLGCEQQSQSQARAGKHSPGISEALKNLVLLIAAALLCAYNLLARSELAFFLLWVMLQKGV